MKTRFQIAAVLCVVAAHAHAESSVTLYGLLDEAIEYNSNAKGQGLYSLGSGGLQGTRWGMRGAEDLGNGLQAIFKLESGFNITNGTLQQGGAEFGRAAYVGLAGHMGSVTVGRQYSVMTTYIGPYVSANYSGNGATSGQWAGPYGAHAGDIDNLGGTIRTNNSVSVDSADYRGLRVGAFYSFGGKAGDFTNDQIFSVAARYHTGPVSFAAAYQNVRDPNYSFWGSNPSASTTASNMSNPIYSGYASARTYQSLAAAGAVQFGNSTLTAVYSNVQFDDLGGASGTGLNPNSLSGNVRFNIGEVSYTYRPTPAVQLGAAYVYTRAGSVGSISGASYNQVNLAADYRLSKRTDLYTVAIYQHAHGEDSTGKAAVAAISGATTSATNQQVTWIAGIRHKF